ncbi:FxsA family protein [Brachybacterium sp. AOP25-B2-12]|uniref:FxsA family protein n=1 Tax=Brachybacterium sp. AOP25-B2-12 TaxID=3457710 RepID=UPI004034C271
MTSAHTGKGRDRRPEGRGARFIPLAIIALGILELTLLIVFAQLTSIWWALLVVAIGWIVGMALLVAAGQQSFVRLRSLFRAVRGNGDLSDHLSRPAFTLLAAGCFFFPGFITDVIGIVLLVVPLQRRVARTVAPVDSSGVRRILYRRGSGGTVIDGEIVITPQDAKPAQDPSRRPEPPVITQE